MKVLMLSKALVVGAYQRKLEEIGQHGGVELVVAVPPSWRDAGHERKLERLHERGYQLVVTPIRMNGNFHLFHFPRVMSLLEEYQPDLVHIDEEPYNLATFHAALAARRQHIPFLFFSWQNLLRTYPAPFAFMERSVYRNADWAVAGTVAAGRVLRAKGYRGPLSVIPQFGVDPEVFHPAAPRAVSNRPFTVGFAGRLVPEKGLSLLIQACSRLQCDYRLEVFGSGPEGMAAEGQVRSLGSESKVSFHGDVPSAQMPERLRSLDALVLPSLSRPNWIEQFGRALVEAMASGVAVIGSTCGEIPEVIGEAGLIFPEGDVAALTAQLKRLADDPERRRALAESGRARVSAHFTQRQVAQETVDVYQRLLSEARPQRDAPPP